MFHWSMFLLLHQYHAVLVITVFNSFQSLLKCDVFSFSFLLQITLAMLGLLWLYMNFKIAYSISPQRNIGILVGIALNL
jgi:hypothetical protein